MDKEYELLTVTHCEVYPFDHADNNKRLGLAKIVLNDQLVLRDLRIMDGFNGLYVGFPFSQESPDDDLRSVFFPITRRLREHIEDTVLEKYQEEKAKATNLLDGEFDK